MYNGNLIYNYKGCDLWSCTNCIKKFSIISMIFLRLFKRNYRNKNVKILLLCAVMYVEFCLWEGGGFFTIPLRRVKQFFAHVTGENFEYVRWDNVGGGILPPPPLHHATGCSGPWIFMLVIYCFSSTSVFSSHCEQLLFTDFFHCNYTEKWLMWVIIRIFI